MATYLQGKTLNEIAVSDACSREVHACHQDELVSHAARTMADAHVRRLPVVDADGRLVGIIAVSDLVRNLCFTRSPAMLADAQRMVFLLEAVSRPRGSVADSLLQMTEDEKESLVLFDTP
jgi:CBS-domain-containing membrane protein